MKNERSGIVRQEILTFKTLGLLGDIFRLAMKMQKEGHTLLPLQLGDPARFDFSPMPSFREGIARAAEKQLSYAYGNPQGYPPLLEKIAGVEGVDARYVFIGNGVSDMMDKLFNAVAVAGTNVLLPAPVFAPYLDINTKFGVESRLYRCDPLTWQPDMADLESLVDDNTSMILVNSPNNPTGAVYHREKLEAVIQLAHETGLERRKRNIAPPCLILDEIYSEHYYDAPPPDVRPLIEGREFSWIIFNGASKSMNVPGLRIGYAVVGGLEKETLREALYNECILPLCVNSIFQEGYLATLCDPAREEYCRANRARLKRRRDLLLDGFSRIPGISVVKPEGAFYMIIRMDTRFETDLELGLALLSEEKICASQMSAFFDARTQPGGTYLRLVILPPENILEDALGRFRRFMEKHGRTA